MFSKKDSSILLRNITVFIKDRDTEELNATDAVAELPDSLILFNLIRRNVVTNEPR